MDLFSILILAGAAFGAAAINSYVSADTVQIRVFVHPRVEESGYTREITEEVMTHEFRKIFEPQSALRLPRLRVRADRSLISVLSRAAGIDDFGFAVQGLLNLDPVRVRVVVGAGPASEEAGLVQSFGSRPDAGFYEVSIGPQAAGAAATIRAAALATARRIDAYHTWLHQARTLDDDTEVAARAATEAAPAADFHAIYGREYAQRLRGFVAELDREVTYSRLYPGADEAALSNLLGIARLRLGDIAGAREAFRSAHEMAPSLDAARLNLALLRLFEGDAAAALEISAAVARRVAADASQNRSVAAVLLAAARATEGQALALLGRGAEASDRWDEGCARLVELPLLIEWNEAPWLPPATAQRCAAGRHDMAARAIAVRALDKLGWELLLLGPPPEAAVMAPMLATRGR
jgi:Flp pilus assembly protein TadD